MNPDPVIFVEDLRKSHGAFEAVKDVDFEVGEGEVFGLLGPNGAGKTTTVEILEGLRQRTAGEVRVLGYDPAPCDDTEVPHFRGNRGLRPARAYELEDR